MDRERCACDHPRNPLPQYNFKTIGRGSNHDYNSHHCQERENSLGRRIPVVQLKRTQEDENWELEEIDGERQIDELTDRGLPFRRGTNGGSMRNRHGKNTKRKEEQSGPRGQVIQVNMERGENQVIVVVAEKMGLCSGKSEATQGERSGEREAAPFALCVARPAANFVCKYTEQPKRKHRRNLPQTWDTPNKFTMIRRT
jgi:hypothetical protein